MFSVLYKGSFDQEPASGDICTANELFVPIPFRIPGQPNTENNMIFVTIKNYFIVKWLNLLQRYFRFGLLFISTYLFFAKLPRQAPH